MSLPKQPYNAYVYFRIGDLELDPIPPQHLQSFNYEKNTNDAGNKILLTCFDKTGLLLEEAISRGYNDCEFCYGYVKGEMSRRYAAMITDYDVDFESGGCVVSITAMSKAVITQSQPGIYVYKEKGKEEGLPIVTLGGKSIISEIAGREGWKIGVIEETKDIPVEGEGIETAEPLIKVYRQENISSIDFIQQVLIPESFSKNDGESGYNLFFDDVEEGIVNFCPPKWKEPPLDIYVYGWGKTSRVLDFNPAFSGLLKAMRGSSKVIAVVNDPVSNDVSKVEYTKDTNAQRSSLGPKEVDKQGSEEIMNISSANKEEAEARTSSMWNKNITEAYDATLTIIGNPNISVYTNIGVIYYLENGHIHHSTGLYFIKSIVDDISGGSFQTTLQLMRNAMSLGDVKSGGQNVNTPDITGGS